MVNGAKCIEIRLPKVSFILGLDFVMCVRSSSFLLFRGMDAGLRIELKHRLRNTKISKLQNCEEVVLAAG